MYSKRIKVFVAIIACLTVVCLGRLVQMQLLSRSYYRGRIEDLKRQVGRYRQLKTLRGKILDRKGRILAVDEPQFRLCIDYSLSSLVDERVEHKAEGRQFQDRLQDLREIINKCAKFRGAEPAQVYGRIREINNLIWNLRAFQAWRRKFPNSAVLEGYESILSVPLDIALADFAKNEPDPFERRKLVNKIDIAEMYESWPLLELETDDDIFTAQLEFDVNGIRVQARAHRHYPYGAVAAQTIGWVGRPQHTDRELFGNDRLSAYLEDEVAGREDGVEYVCETMLRGRRGEAVYDIDRRLVSRTDTEFGDDVTITIDVELQQRIERHITDCNLNLLNCKAPTAAVVIDVATGQILVLASTPTYDLNRARYDWVRLDSDSNQPLRNRAIYKHYPPGSVIKPIILIAGLESGKVSSEEVISCPAQAAPRGWPSCWIYNRYKTGHDYSWQNHARNAIKGSCNIYFSRLAARVEPRTLQNWLFKFGYGRKILFPPAAARLASPDRNLRQAAGQIGSSVLPAGIEVFFFEQIPPLSGAERRWFGIGQGSLRVTVLQVANAMAALARGGFYKLPRLFMEAADPCEQDSRRTNSIEQNDIETDLGISGKTLDVLIDGMSAVVNESGGTAHRAFEHSGFAEQGVRVWGKTGSTEKPDNAWFGGFARDGQGRSVALAVVVEGGQHGSRDAAPLARDIIQFAIEAGYIGQGAAASADGQGSLR